MRIVHHRGENLKHWIGAKQHTRDTVSSGAVQRFSAVLDYEIDNVSDGYPLPPLWHWLFFLPSHRQSELGADGHARRGGFLPPVPLPRRMWAGGRFEWHDQLRAGDKIARESTIENVALKTGRSGELVFVTVRHEIHGLGGDLALSEWHDIVYRSLAKPSTSEPQPEHASNDAIWTRHWKADDVLLFRYSALTFNGHRIHYDRRYCLDVEGYPGLVVHGPFLATLLMELARQHNPDRAVHTFSFRSMRPVFDIHEFETCGSPERDSKSAQLWVRDHEGSLAMQASVTFR